jgi:predicted nucleotidyltransferase
MASSITVLASYFGTVLARGHCMTRADIDVVVRCKDEMPFVVETLRALRGYRVVVFDSGSKDGSREVAEREGVRIVDVDPKAYVPGRVLDAGMRATTSSIVAFVNADAIPQREDAVDRLVAACEAGVGAAFGRQEARPETPAFIRADHDRAFPPAGGPPVEGFFSMAASAIRRDVWDQLHFDGSYRFSEDVEWTLRLRSLGVPVRYVGDAVFQHAHDYTLGSLYKRMRGEGAADARFDRSSSPSVVGHLLRPLAGTLVRDVRAGVATPRTLGLRVAAQIGRFVGRAQPKWAHVPPVPAVGAAAVEASRPAVTAGPAPRPLPASVDAALARGARAILRELGGAVQAVVLVGSLASDDPSLTVDDSKAVRPRNDADVLAVVATHREARALRAAAIAASAAATKAAGFEVDVAPIARGDIEALRGRLMFVDAALRGVRVLAGDPTVVAPLATLTAADVSLDELRRLLANRATGLALSRLAAAYGGYDAEAAARHVAKAWFAAGDVVLFRSGTYARRVADRCGALGDLAAIGSPDLAALAAGYGTAAAWSGRSTPIGLDVPGFDAARARLFDAYAFAAPPIERGAGRAKGLDDMIARTLPRELADVPFVAQKAGGLRAVARGVVGVRRAFVHPRVVLADASMRLAFAPDVLEACADVATELAAESANPSAVRAALLRLRGVAA